LKRLAVVITLNVALAAPAAALSLEPAEPMDIVVFISRDCPRCGEVEALLTRLVDRPHATLRAVHYYVDNHDGPEQLEHALMMLQAFDHHYNTNAQPPTVYVGDLCFNGTEAILDGLADGVKSQLLADATTYVPTAEDLDALFADDGASKLLENVTIGGVVVAGLLDGINPCAFTTIIFLLSMLTYLGKSRREIAAVGIGFTVAIFVTYFLIGLGLLGAVRAFSMQRGIAKGISYGVGVLALGLAIWSFVDFVRYTRSKDASKATLGLPASIKKRVHAVIRGGLKARRLLLGSMVVGFLVAVLESLCTGQVYLPTITVVARNSDLRAHAIGYLLLYNVMFILPLVALLAAGYWGVSSERMGQFLRRHLGVVKLLLALLFAFLGVLVLVTA